MLAAVPQSNSHGTSVLRDLLAQNQAPLDLTWFLVNLLLGALLALILGRAYVRFGTSLANRRAFASNFVLITMTTLLIITVVKSSLALSLGLVGALSIVRFRTPVKEPEELAYLFLTISLGLGLGADQRLLTVVAFVVILVVIWLRHLLTRPAEGRDLCLTVQSRSGGRVRLQDIVGALKPSCRTIELRRCDETADGIDASFLVEFDDLARFEAGRAALRQLDPAIAVSFLDQKGLI